MSFSTVWYANGRIINISSFLPFHEMQNFLEENSRPEKTKMRFKICLQLIVKISLQIVLDFRITF